MTSCGEQESLIKDLHAGVGWLAGVGGSGVRQTEQQVTVFDISIVTQMQYLREMVSAPYHTGKTGKNEERTYFQPETHLTMNLLSLGVRVQG